MRFLLPSLSLLLASGLLAQDRSLPDVDTLYQAVRENLAKAERVAYLYAFKERRTDVHTNPFGRIGTGGTRLFDVYPSPDPELTYRRLIERDGAPVDVRDLADQDRDYEERVADVRQQSASRRDEERRRRDEDAEDAEDASRRKTMIEDVVDALQFTFEGPAVHDGVPALVVSFSPRPGARPKTRQGRTAQKFAGTVWIHEAASEVMRVEAKSVDSISFGLGIVARLGEGTTATLARQPVEGGVWMPTGFTMSGRGRVALFRRLELDYAVEWFDYRRLPGDSLAPFLADAQIPDPMSR